uniref:Uncharacterized protein n=1 Tax=Rhizophora mucronata TaxID=61149 RepID=A0A2P2JDA7_RHIMU
MASDNNCLSNYPSQSENNKLALFQMWVRYLFIVSFDKIVCKLMNAFFHFLHYLWNFNRKILQ